MELGAGRSRTCFRAESPSESVSLTCDLSLLDGLSRRRVFLTWTSRRAWRFLLSFGRIVVNAEADALLNPPWSMESDRCRCYIFCLSRGHITEIDRYVPPSRGAMSPAQLLMDLQ